MGIISFVCKIGIMAYAIDWLVNKNSATSSKSPAKQSGRETPVFHCTPTKPTDVNAPIIYASELSNGRVGLEIDLPGLSSEHLNLTIREGEKMIVLRGEKPANEETGDKARAFAIKIALPDSADLNDIHAKMENGVLKVDVGKKAFEGTRIHIE